MKVQVTLLIRPHAHSIGRYRRIPICRASNHSGHCAGASTSKTKQGGAKSMQCVQPGTAPDTLGVCACSPCAKDKGLQTRCYVTAGEAVALKRCKGTRACGSEDLGACEPV